MSWLLPDPHDTDIAAIDTSTQDITRRWYTPFGRFRPPVNGTWPGTRRFVGGTYDHFTGLVNLGAREYNPAAPAFISPAPILDPHNPASLDPYNYASNNPATHSDPTGLCAKADPGSPPVDCKGRSHQTDGGDPGGVCNYCYPHPTDGDTTSTIPSAPIAHLLRQLPTPQLIPNPASSGGGCMPTPRSPMPPGTCLHHHSDNLLSTIGHGLAAAGHFVWNRGAIATVIAVGICLSGVGDRHGWLRPVTKGQCGGCAHYDGLRDPDCRATIEFGASVAISYRVILNGAATIPDVGFVGGFLPGHERVFFNGNTLSW